MKLKRERNTNNNCVTRLRKRRRIRRRRDLRLPKCKRRTGTSRISKNRIRKTLREVLKLTSHCSMCSLNRRDIKLLIEEKRPINSLTT
jgi:hypothetical protein